MYVAPSHPPIEVQAIDIGAYNITLTWSPPLEEYHNGVIRSYSIGVLEVESGHSFVVRTLDLEHSLLHLHPYYTYNISVAAATVSTGPYSPNISVKTLQTRMCVK